MNASRIAMLLALVGLIYVLSPWSFSFDQVNQVIDGSFPWVLFALVLFFASRKGGCGSKSARCIQKYE